MVVGMIGMVIFNLVDTFYISRLGITQLAAMSFTLPVVMVLASISMGIGVGAASVISHAIGTGDSKGVQRLTTDSLFLSVAFVTVFVLLGLVTVDPLFRAMGATDDTLKLINQYMIIWYLGMPFVVVPMVGNNAIRAAGNTKIPSLIMLAATLVNIVLDPLLIFGIGPFPRLELQGAAIATVIARCSTLILSMYYLRFHFDMLTAHIPRFSIIIASWKRILYVGIPAALTQLILPISMAIITRMVASYGEAAVAAYGIGTRVEMFAMAPLMSLSAVMIPFTGQNLGAGAINRIDHGIRISHLFSLVFGFFVFLVFFFFGHGIARIFNPDAGVINVVVTYLLVVSAGYGFQGIIAVSAASFSALNHPLHALSLNIFRMAVLYIPISFFASHYWGLAGVFSGASISAFIAGVISIFWIRSFVRGMFVREAVAA